MNNNNTNKSSFDKKLDDFNNTIEQHLEQTSHNTTTISDLKIGDTVYAVEKINGEFQVQQFTVCKTSVKDCDVNDGQNKTGEPIYKKKPFLYLTMIHNNQRYAYKTDDFTRTNFLILETNPTRCIDCFIEYTQATNFICHQLNEEYKILQKDIHEKTLRINDIEKQLQIFQ